MDAAALLPPSPSSPLPVRRQAMSSDYARIERAIHYIEEHLPEQPGLAELAAVVGLSEFHFQRLFQRWAGVSPKAFLQFLTLGEAKRLLAQPRSLLESSLALGLSGPSRLHDLFLKLEAMTPGDYKQHARGMVVRWGVHSTPLGQALFAATERGLCGLAFLGEAPERDADEMRARWPGATWREEPGFTRPYAVELEARLRGQPSRPLPLLLKGTPFQLKVWEALLRIPEGAVVTYTQVAALAGATGAPRAVGAAIGANPVGYLIPCHRVIRASGAFGGYHWGLPRKRALLALEHARAAASGT
jgi:AraC family transcriptional regulator of adaptative response/methylated-DNA-[protein]-cysteine methyltransferase